VSRSLIVLGANHVGLACFLHGGGGGRRALSWLNRWFDLVSGVVGAGRGDLLCPLR
jgi:hypothetical protein